LRLEQIGKLESLQNLSLESPTSKSVLPLERLLSQFPLEQIQKLRLGNITESFFALSSHLTNLKYLRLTPSYTDTITFPGELFPSLIELRTNDFRAIQLAEMIRLRNLEIHNTPSHQILGNEEFHSQLKSFSYSCSSDPVYDESYLWVLKNAAHLSLRTAPRPDFFDPAVSVKLSSLNLCSEGREVTIPDRFFEVLRLHNCKISSSSSFSQVQILVLDYCAVTDISSCKDIPYLELRHLSRVKDFSPLGNQRYLMIWECQALSSDAVRRFRNVFYLHIYRCHKVNEVGYLNGNNKYLILKSCGGLRSVELAKEDYISVKILKCNYLDNFKIIGTVYALGFTINERWTKDMIPRKYQYLNGEKEE
jgi:hypothetical protein